MSKETTSRINVLKTYKLYIGGAFPRTESGRYDRQTNAKGDLVANICRASRKDFRNAMVAARKAQRGWAARSAFNRSQILYRMAEMLESRSATFERALEDAAGYKKKDAAAEVATAIDRLVWYAGWCDKFTQLFGNTNPVASAHFNFTFPEAMGVVTVLAPKSAPLLGLISTFAPVIVGGNSTIVVVDNDAPTIAIELAEVLATSDLPGGVVNILTGRRDELTPHIGSHMDLDAIFAVGSDKDEERALSIAATESIKRTKFIDDRSASEWRDADAQSPYMILPFIEFKTAWHPIGGVAGGGGAY